MSAVAGIFVGGRAERMGGAAKGLLAGPDGRPIVERMRDLLRSLGLDVVLVGSDPRYDSLGLRAVDDEPGGIGPLGGLIGLLRHADDRAVVAIACDMPFIQAPLVEQLLAAPPASAVAPRRGTRWEPLFARYAPESVLPAARERASRGERSLQGLLDAVGARELVLTEDEWRQLRDWDTPSDVGALSVRRPATDEEMLQEYPRRARAPHWFIRVEEISAYVYRVSARDRWGHECSHTGTEDDLPRLIEDVERYAEGVARNSK